MRISRRCTLAMMSAALLAADVSCAADPSYRVGAPAPAFSLADSNGRTVTLAGLRGKTVVLEWTNPDCPYVRKHYDSGNMQKLQAAATGQGIVWVTVSSAAPGNVGYFDALEANAWLDELKAKPSHYAFDRDGKVLAAYGVQVALTMAVITPDGVLAYHGAIDDKPTAKPEDVQGATNYIQAALVSVAAGHPVKPAQTRAYGCVAR